MLTLTTRTHEGAPSGTLVLPFESREKSRLRASLDTGEEVALFLPRGIILRGGDLLTGEEGRVIRVEAAVEATYRIECPDAMVLARCAYHLGNRHASVQVIAADSMLALRIREDSVFRGMLEGLGASVVPEQAPFEPEAGAYAAGHHHHSMGARHAGVIHDFQNFSSGSNGGGGGNGHSGGGKQNHG